ncbi:MAG: TraB/GumN family protein [Hyphomonadaceae bacterium]|nr:TraB/GumN family protein [Hyphomonadaceae bacterium]
MQLSGFYARARSVAVAFAALAIAACSPAAEEKPDTGGLPMWVIEDADSTIYLTGTVHMLPPDVDWRSKKLDKALDDASELWLELPMPTSQEAMMKEYGPLMMRKMFSFNRPLSSLLTEEEKLKLAEAIERAKLPPESAAGLEMMKPWAVSMMIGMGPLISSGYDAEEGIDINLARLAEEQDDDIKGFETFEQQMDMLAGGSEEEQLEGLRAVLNAPPESADDMQKQSEAAYEGWARGDVKAVEDLVTAMRSGAGADGMSMEVMLDNRNENWAGQIEERLKGEGVSFVAVGAAHLVGSKSVQERLKLRGIEAKPY